METMRAGVLAKVCTVLAGGELEMKDGAGTLGRSTKWRRSTGTDTVSRVRMPKICLLTMHRKSRTPRSSAPYSGGVEAWGRRMRRPVRRGPHELVQVQADVVLV